MVLNSENIKNKIIKEQIEPVLNLKLAIDAYRIHLKHLFDPMSCVATGRIDPLPHQIESFVKMMNMLRPHGDTAGRIRVLLADDVGLGKTIMIGMVLKELLLSSKIKKVLIVCPAGLQIQWKEELLFKFAEDFEIVSGPVGMDNPYKTIDKVITSMDYAKTPKKLELLKDTHWDLVIIDEAHKLKYGNQRFDLGEVLSENSSHLILATATPHDGKVDNFLALLGLLDQNLQFTEDQYELLHYLDPILIRRMKTEVTDFKGNSLFPHREKPFTIDIDFSLEEQEFYDYVGYYVNKYYRIATERKKFTAVLALYILHRMVSSSIYAGLQALKNRRGRLWEPYLEPKSTDIYYDYPEDLDAQTREADDEIVIGSTASMGEEIKEELEVLDDLIDMGQKLVDSGIDSKGHTLLEGLNELRKSRPNDKIILFTEFRPTLAYLKQIIEDEGFSVVKIHGGMDIKEREFQTDLFEKNADILIGTDAISEGLNIQFANIVVNYELPWNPNKLEQRIGRAYRYGQKKPVYVYNYKTGFKIDNHVLSKLLEKIEEIRIAFGDRTVDVIGSLISEKEMMEIFRIVRTVGDSDASEKVRSLLDEKLRLIDNIEQYMIKTRFDLTEILKASRKKELGVVKFDIERFLLSYLTIKENGSYDRIDKNTYILDFKPANNFENPNCIDNIPNYRDKGYDFKGTFDKESDERIQYVALGNSALNMALHKSMNYNGVSLFHGEKEGILLPYVIRFFDSLKKEVYAELVIVFKDKNGFKIMDPLQLWDMYSYKEDISTEKIESLIDSIDLSDLENAMESHLQDLNKFALEKHQKDLELDLKRINADFECKIAIEERNIRKAKENGQTFLIPGHDDNINVLRSEHQRIISELEVSSNIHWNLCAPLCYGIVLKSVKETGISQANEEMKKKVEMAGVEYVIKNEENSGRKVLYNSLDKEDFRGYDLLTKSDIEERLIEVKSFKSSGNIILTSSEWRVASENPENFYLYVVFNALSNPKLIKLIDPYNNLQNVVHIVPKEDYTININPDDLHKIVEDTLFPLRVVTNDPISIEDEKYSKIKEILLSQDFLDWIEKLPFPLASILWSYQAHKNINDRLETLLNFFEAFAEFQYTILNSLLVASNKGNNEVFNEELSVLIEKSSGYGYWFNNPSFGKWIKQSERLAKHIRTITSDTNRRAPFLEITGMSPDFIKQIVKRPIINLLEDAAKIRNDKSHKRCKDLKKCLKMAETTLNDFWMTTSTLFDDVLLIIPETSKTLHDGFVYDVKKLMGSRSEFIEYEVKTKTSMTYKSLYLINRNFKIPLKLQFFVRVLESQKTGEDAFYFYNKRDDKTITWVSYHYGPQSELLMGLDSQLNESLILLIPNQKK